MEVAMSKRQNHRIQFLFLLLSMVCAKFGPCYAHEGHHSSTSDPDPSSRTWTFANTGLSFRGAYVMSSAEKVQIRRNNGILMTADIGDLTQADQDWVHEKFSSIRLFHDPMTKPTHYVRTKANASPLLQMEKAFEPFVKLNGIQLRNDANYFYVESSGIPTHRMMVGITAWQQQVPIPQHYIGANAWQIPISPVPAKNPLSTKNRFLRGAIALAVNGVPIFNPLNNRGEDAFLLGELDEYGGHCGRADDYHYHLAPVHLEKIAGRGSIIAYALDGYPIYGYEEPDGSPVKDLDKFNGHYDANGQYHYHATQKYPYLNGGFFGEVVEREGQVDPQPRAEPIRNALPPLRDAKITEFTETTPGSYRLKYDLRGKSGFVNYTIDSNGSARFEYIAPNGRVTNESYSPNRRAPARGDRSPPPPPPPKRPSAARSPSSEGKDASQAASQGRGQPARKTSIPALKVTSKSVGRDGKLSIDCTCDGKRNSPAIAWERGPAGTKFYAITLWHIAPDMEKSYWVIYDIPEDVTEIGENGKGIGKVGLNDRRKAEYEPMCSKGPGLKEYHVTVYALSSELMLAPGSVDRSSLLKAIQTTTVAEGTLDFNYERKR